VLSAVEFLRVREQARTLEQVEAMTFTDMSLAAGDSPLTIRVGVASAGYLDLFGLTPTLGRGYSDAEARARAAVVVLDGGLWQQQFAGDPAILGATVSLDGRPYEVIGVTPPGYQPQLQPIAAWIPLEAAVDPARVGARNLIGAARLSRDASVEQAQNELRRIQSGIARDFPQTHGRATLIFRDMHEALYGSYRPILRLLLAAVGVLLLIACINVTHLMLGRVSTQQPEIALRVSLGASRGRILRAQLTEAALLALLGMVLGGLLAWWLLQVLLGVDPAALPRDVEIRLSARLASMAAGLLVVVTVLAGLAPAWRAGWSPATAALSQSSTRVTGQRDRRTGNWIMGLQVAFAVVLLSAAGAVAATFLRLAQADPGFDSHQVLTLQLAPPSRYPTPQQRAAFVARVLDRIAEIPGVTAAGSTQTLWQSGTSMSSPVEIEGLAATAEENVFANIRHVTPGYFEALRIATMAGRPVDRRDVFGAAPVAVVSESFAARFWPGQEAVGRRIRRRSIDAPWLTVVGVVREVTDSGLASPIGATFYVPYLQQNTPTARVTLVVRTHGDPTAYAATIQQAVWSIDRQQPIDGVKTVDAALSESMAQSRFRAVVLGAFGITGLALACLGVYGVAAYAAGRRRREVGVRLALGAERTAVAWMLVWQAMLPIIAGALTGSVASLAVARTLGGVLAPGEALDLSTVPIVASVLVTCALLATWLPAQRAARVAPVTSLRDE
jgi:putative ABC transport system permease protein